MDATDGYEMRALATKQEREEQTLGVVLLLSMWAVRSALLLLASASDHESKAMYSSRVRLVQDGVPREERRRSVQRAAEVWPRPRRHARPICPCAFVPSTGRALEALLDVPGPGRPEGRHVAGLAGGG